jgi:hypothetical protein
MRTITTFEPDFQKLLPETYAIVSAANLTVHDAVTMVVLEGSRGLEGKPRPDSDVDVSLLVDGTALPPDDPAREALLRDVIDTTLDHWRGAVELDTAAVFDIGHGLALFEQRYYDETFLPECADGRFGIYKTQKGFNGYVPPSVIDLKLVYPMLVIWRR